MISRILALVFLGAILSYAQPQAQQSWSPLLNQPGFSAGTPLLLTDGTVMVQHLSSGQWSRLTPDSNGSYINGTWSQLASMPAGYGPLYYASAVLPDGRVIVEGGEYNFSALNRTNLGAIYDPLSNSWAPISPPAGWSTIGDAQSAVLANGTFMLANCCTTEAALLNATTLTWTATGNNKADSNSEESWTLLPNGRVLTVDVFNSPNSETYNPSNGKWTSAGSTIVPLSSGSPAYEIGPAVLRPNGTVFATGGTSNTAIYNTSTGTWSVGPSFPNGLDIADGPAALLPNGNVLVQASPGIFNPPSQFFEFDGASLNPTANPPRASVDSSYVGTMLVLPTGQILVTDQSNDVEIYTPGGTYQSAWKPTISSAPSVVNPGSLNNAISGTQFNGLSQGAMYGDDSQTATNYPLVRIINNATGHVSYARTHDHSTMGVATGSAIVSTRFDVPSTAEAGASTLQVVANGIPSNAVNITVGAPLTNLALNKPATQSSTAFGGTANRAVDGNSSGIFTDGSITSTAGGFQDWWEVDLGAASTIQSMRIFNRTECCGDRLNNSYVLVSDTPFGTRTLSQLLADPTITSFPIGQAPASLTLSVNRSGRYVRVQLSGTNYLSLAEVQVNGNAAAPPPPPTNIALNKPATQSSTEFGGTANRAVDGNTSGIFTDGSITSTAGGFQDWWEVDLVAVSAIQSVKIYNRTECCGDRLNNSYVLVSDTPFGTRTLSQLLADPTINSYPIGQAPALLTLSVNRSGRYVRVQLSGTNYLSLAEVQVLGTSSAPTNIALNKQATQSSTEFGGTANRAVDGNTSGIFTDGSITSTAGGFQDWWEVDLGGASTIQSVNLYNRTECCGDRLNNSYVLVSDTPFGTRTLSQLLADPTINSYPIGQAPALLTLSVNRSGRYVRVQLSGSNYLSLAEVQVIGTFN